MTSLQVVKHYAEKTLKASFCLPCSRRKVERNHYIHTVVTDKGLYDITVVNLEATNCEDSEGVPFDKDKMELLVDSHHGIYSAQLLAERYTIYGLGKRQVKDLKAGPENEHYWDAVDSLGSGYVLISNKAYQIMLDEDIWAVPADMFVSPEDAFAP